MRTRLFIAAFAVLAVGIVAALAIYLNAGDDATNAALDEMLGSKAYNRQLQHFGGKASVLFDEISRWFAGLWHGRALASTVLWTSVAVSALLALIARRLEK